MEIENIKLTRNELHEAVEQWLRNNGVRVEVSGVDTFGYPVKGYDIECKVTMATINPEVADAQPAQAQEVAS